VFFLVSVCGIAKKHKKANPPSPSVREFLHAHVRKNQNSLLSCFPSETIFPSPFVKRGHCARSNAPGLNIVGRGPASVSLIRAPERLPLLKSLFLLFIVPSGIRVRGGADLRLPALCSPVGEMI